MTKDKKVTKKWRMERARQIIDKNVIDVPFCVGDVSEFASVCEQPITGAVRKINPEFYNDPRHLRTEIDGIWEARSWRKFIYPISEKQNAKRVMRHIARDDMREFFQSVDPKQCEYCYAIDDLTVDHVAPPFDEIANKFIEKFGCPKLDDPKLNKIINTFSDMDMEAMWIAFHASMACYQILCRPCNSKKGKTQ